MRKFLLMFVFLGGFIWVRAQQPVVIPGFTGYAFPTEKYEANLFDAKNGLQNWTDLNQNIQYSFFVRNTGSLEISMTTKNELAGSMVAVSIAGKTFQISINKSTAFTNQLVGKLIITDTGFYTINIKGIKKAGKTIADIQSLELRGAASIGLHTNTKERRNAASVHLRYPISDTSHAIAFYNEITIPENADVVHSYYMSNGFARGYFGVQVNSSQERRVIFSIWDAGKEAVDRGKVADSNRVKLLAKGEGVIANDFGNEGTGGHSHWVYPWKTGITYKLLVTALPDSATRTTIYTGYFYLPELQKWKLIACFSAPKDAGYLRNLYSFNENFDGANGQLQRKAYFGNQWIQRENGSWQELTQSSFSYDATGKAGDRIDYGGGEKDGRFYLWNGGFQTPTAKFGQVFTRSPLTIKPVIDFTKNADSLAQDSKDKQLIFQAVNNKQLDTTGSKEGVYYQIIKEGTGAFVKVTDTLSVNYKGTLLSNGTVFDQSKDKPAIFPLKRLIKGWQIGLTMCKVGGKIRLIIPSAIAYNIRSRSSKIPPNSVLVFDIEVLTAK